MTPNGKNVMIWQLKNCTGRNMTRLADALAEMGVTRAWVKVADGLADMNDDLLGTAIIELAKVNIDVWGWQYLYGGNIYTGASIASKEADAAIRQINQYGLQGYILDPESQYKRKGAAAWADTYMTKLRAAFPKMPIGLCSYRYPSLHPELPWANFLRHCDFHAPQVYWLQAHNPAEQLVKSYLELTALKMMPVVPVGAAYSEYGWQPTVAELDDFDDQAHCLQLPGVSWWAWDDNGIEAHPEFYTAIKAHDWNPTPPPIEPPPNPVHGIEIGEMPAIITRLEKRLTQLDSWARTQGYSGEDM